MKYKVRSLSKTFLAKFKEGEYKPIVDMARIDPYLDFEMRGRQVMIYYRGGKILTINEFGDKDKIFEPLDSNYKDIEDAASCPAPSMDNLYEYISKAKMIVDQYEDQKRKHLAEKEYQQRITFENNLSVNAKDTDYFIADVEWADNNLLGGRADIIAFRKEHRSNRVQLTLIEVKQGTNAMTTAKNSKTGKDSAGLCKHYADYLTLKSNAEYIGELKKDMLNVLIQKKKLGLVNGFNNLLDNTEAIRIEKDVDFVFSLCNYYPYSDILRLECEKLPDDCKFMTSSYMGYGMYKDFILTKKELINSMDQKSLQFIPM